MSKDQTKHLFEVEESINDRADLHVVRVAFDTGADGCFDYAVPTRFWPIETGQRVEVPFGKSNKLLKGFCVKILDKEETAKTKHFRLKTVKKVLDNEPLLDDGLMELSRWISEYYVCPLGQVLAAMVPAAVKKGIGVKKEKQIYLSQAGIQDSEPLTSAKQKRIVEVLKDHKALDADHAIDNDVLLHEAGCTNVPLKHLHRKQIVTIIHREIIRSLPVIPEGLRTERSEVVLNVDQQQALETIEKEFKAARFGVSLLHGVTDSGKTEVYIRAIERVVTLGKQAIVLLPEIALTTQTINRFSKRLERIAVLHSRLTAAQRNAQWQNIRAGRADVVIGARSAVFAPVRNLGLIVVDEEHEPGYKQDTVPRYHGRDVAIKRAQLAGAHCILGSATPSLESLCNSRNLSHYQRLELPSRVMDHPMPAMKMVDMTYQIRGEGGIRLISEELEQAIRETLARKEQIILLLNRRGYSNFVFCSSCHYSLHCRNCDVPLTFHKRRVGSGKTDTILGRHMSSGYAICHYCLSKTLVPQECPLCGGGMTMIGLGSQRLTEELQQKIPDTRVLRIDSDAMETGGAERYYQILEDFAAGRVDILAGTQILAKGLHFPNVTLVGIVSADTALALPDFRSNERTFQLISQVAGRAGRSEKPGSVIVQTFLPDQPSIRYAMKYDYAGFVEAELPHRRSCNLPPFWRLAIVHLRDPKFDRLETACKEMARRIEEIIASSRLNIRIRGPMPATISRIHGQHRMQIILQAPDARIMGRLLSALRNYAPLRPTVQVVYDVDAISVL
ncbi:MAG: primosomal protein N' [Sedimentisphaerales bacterium]|nr:primosomal protein N' [Sedimentisphaerales bacterium]